MNTPDLSTLLAKRGLGVAELERLAGTGRESLRRLVDGRRAPLRTSTGVILRLAQATHVSVERFLAAIEQTRASNAEMTARRQRVAEAIEAARRGE